MKKLLRHIILWVLILDTTSLYQVLKLPSLIRHFTEHKALNRNIGFVDFLSMHYWGEDLDDDDDEKDMQLPFKKFEVNHVNFVPWLYPATFSFETTNWPEVKADYGPDQPQVHYNALLGSLFRPPQA